MNNIKKITLIFLTLILFSCGSNSEIINTKLVKKHLYTLASDDMEGRKAGTPGCSRSGLRGPSSLYRGDSAHTGPSIRVPSERAAAVVRALGGP